MGSGLVNLDLKGIGEGIGKIGGLFRDIRTAITGKEIEDPAKLLEIEGKLIEAQSTVDAAQSKINEIEAGSSSLFVAGWRPACGWLCVIGLAWSIFVYPFWVWLTKLCSIPAPPEIDTAVLVSILIGMLGLGAYRSYEKKQGIQNKH